MDGKKLNAEDLYPNYLHIGSNYLNKKSTWPPFPSLPHNINSCLSKQKKKRSICWIFANKSQFFYKSNIKHNTQAGQWIPSCYGIIIRSSSFNRKIIMDRTFIWANCERIRQYREAIPTKQQDNNNKNYTRNKAKMCGFFSTTPNNTWRRKLYGMQKLIEMWKRMEGWNWNGMLIMRIMVWNYGFFFSTSFCPLLGCLFSLH